MTDLLHDPRVSDLAVLRAAAAIVSEAGSDAASLMALIAELEAGRAARVHESVCPICEGDGRLAIVTRPGRHTTCQHCGGSGKREPTDERVCEGLGLPLMPDDSPALDPPWWEAR